MPIGGIQARSSRPHRRTQNIFPTSSSGSSSRKFRAARRSSWRARAEAAPGRPLADAVGSIRSPSKAPCHGLAHSPAWVALAIGLLVGLERRWRARDAPDRKFGWRHALTGVPVDIHPTHWRNWIERKRSETTSMLRCKGRFGISGRPTQAVISPNLTPSA